MKFNVAVSHPGKQYVHQLLLALEKAAISYRFFTTVWDKRDNKSLKIIKKVFPFVADTFTKRYFDPLNDSNISINILPEFMRFVLSKILPSQNDRWVFMVDRMHDNHTARKLKKINYDLLLAYENSSYKSLKEAKARGKITILDLAQVHHSMIEDLRNRFSDFRDVINNEIDFRKVNALKEEQNRFVDYFLVLSELAKQSLLQAGVLREKIYKVTLGFDPNAFSMKVTYERKSFTVLYVGTITKRKGIHLVIEAFRQLSLPDSHLRIIGPAADAVGYLKNLPDNISYLPFTHHNELVAHYQEADVFVFPSYLDSWAMVVLEAMACGTPVIVSENTGSREAVSRGGGYVISPGNVEELKSKMLLLYNDRTLLESIGRRAFEIAQDYTWNRYHQEIKAVLEDICLKRSTHL